MNFARSPFFIYCSTVPLRVVFRREDEFYRLWLGPREPPEVLRGGFVLSFYGPAPETLLLLSSFLENVVVELSWFSRDCLFCFRRWYFMFMEAEL